MQSGQEVLLRDDICAVQLFGHNQFERIPKGSVVLADRASTYARMFEVIWRQKRYIVFQRDLEERTEPALRP